MVKATVAVGLVKAVKGWSAVYSDSDFVPGESSGSTLAEVASLVSSFQPWLGSEGSCSSQKPFGWRTWQPDTNRPRGMNGVCCSTLSKMADLQMGTRLSIQSGPRNKTQESALV